MLIAPIIFCTVVIGIAHVGDLKSVGRIGVKALIYFELVTTFALLFGLGRRTTWCSPAPDSTSTRRPWPPARTPIASKTGNGELPHTVEFILSIIPTSVISAFAENELLQVLFFAVLFGLGLAKLGDQGAAGVVQGHRPDQPHLLHHRRLDHEVRAAGRVRRDGLHHRPVRHRIAGQLRQADRRLLPRRRAVHPDPRRWSSAGLAGVNLWKFLRYIKDELFLALGTASTEVVLPRIMVKLTDAGCSRTVTGLVVPTGYSFNLDGATLYLSICFLFLAQATRRGPEPGRPAHRRAGADADLQGHGRRARLVVPGPVRDGRGHRPRRHSRSRRWRCCSAPTGSWTPCGSR